MTKLVFRFERQFNETITLVSNNIFDLKKHLMDEFGFYSVEVWEVDRVEICVMPGDETEYGTLERVSYV